MRSPLAFLCFDIDHDEDARSAFVAQLDGSNAVSVDHWSTRPGTPRDDWNNLVRTNISRCDLMIVLVGAESASSDGVRHEIGFAKRSNVPFFGIYIEGATGSKLPEGLSANRTTKWDWAQISAALKQMMAEGKNHAPA